MQLDQIQHHTSGVAVERLGLIHRVYVPEGDGPHPTLVMVHGKDGTEDVTWIFARAAGPEWLIVTPRAPLDPANGGYRWTELPPEATRADETFTDGLHALTQFMAELPNVYPVDPSRVVILGFSQGAAMSYAYLAENPAAVIGMVGLAGFIPPHVAAALPDLHQLPVLLLHGTKDDTVPVEIARVNREHLIAANAALIYQEAEVGHKISSQGLAELKRWLRERLDQSTVR